MTVSPATTATTTTTMTTTTTETTKTTTELFKEKHIQDSCKTKPCPVDHICLVDKRGSYKCACISLNCMLSTYGPNTEPITIQPVLTTSTTTTTSTTAILITKLKTNPPTTVETTTVSLNMPQMSEPMNPCESSPCQSGHICISNRANTEYQCICISRSCLEVTTTKPASAFITACLDSDPAACRFAKAQQLCSNNNYINSVEVTVYCKKSCNTCDNTP